MDISDRPRHRDVRLHGGPRGRRARKTIKSIAGCTSEELFEVVEKFRIPSRSFITPRQNVPLTDDSIIDLSHESLMRLWDRVKGMG